MTLGDIFMGGCGGLVLVLTLVQIAPIHIDPWGCLVRWIGQKTNAEVIRKVDKLADDVSTLSGDLQVLRGECESYEAIGCRARILRFGDELLQSKRHSKEHFDQILLDITAYEQYCAAHPDFANSVAIMTIRHIKDVYAERLNKNDFL